MTVQFALKSLAILTVTSLAVAATQGLRAEEISVWEHEKEEDQHVLDEVIKKYEAANPGSKVKRSHYSTEDLRAQFQTAAMGSGKKGGGGDVVIAPNDFAGPFSTMGIIKPVQSWAKVDRFYATTTQAVTDEKGQVWGMPISNGNHLMLFVNKKLVPTPPKTVEEMAAAAKKISDPAKNKYGLVYNLNEAFWFVTFLGAYGVDPLVNRKPTLNSQGMVDALKLVHDFKFKDKIVPQDCDYACAETLFVEGKAGMIINGDWAVVKYAPALKEKDAKTGVVTDNLLIAPLPKLASTGKPMVPYVSGKYMFFNKNLKGKKLEEAQKFAEFLVSKPIQEFWLSKSYRLPVLKEMAKSDVVTKDVKIQAMMTAMENGRAMPMVVEMRVVWDSIKGQLQSVMAGRVQPDIAAKEMQVEADKRIKELKM